MSMPLTRKLRFLFVYPLAVWLLLVAETTERSFRLGVAFVMLGELVRLWADGYVGHVKVNWTQQWRGDAKVGSLVTAGPYAFVRHPLYLGTFLIGVGFCIIGGNPWMSVAALAFFLTVYRRKMAKEEVLLLDEIGASYLAYQAAVPRWVPTLRRYPNRQGRWSWQGLAASKEWKTVIWVLVVIIGLYFREEILQEHEFLPTSKPSAWLKQVILLVTALVLMLTDGVAELTLRRRRALKSASHPAG